jgi:purine-nucleoside/S-methyl-5'-thioadenosine phosphorylase / adenosine deaminase
VTELALQQPAINLPEGIRIVVTTREGGVSQAPWNWLNLAEHVQDDPAAVAANRALLKTELLGLTGSAALEFQWLDQVHGTTVHHAAESIVQPPPQADALYSTRSQLVCGVLTADCLPVVFYAEDASEVAIAHAGWRGLQGGILENTLRRFKTSPEKIMVWMGPAIGPCHFEVGNEVRDAFVAVATAATVAATEAAFTVSSRAGKWFADLYQLARIRLQAAGLVHINGNVDCTVCNTATWYSYRHSPLTGRFATLVVKLSNPES